MIHASRWLLIAAIAGLLIVFVGINLAIAGARALSVPGFWQARMRQPVGPNAIRLVALGDSSVEAIGAGQPMDGYVGRIATYIHEKTGRPVHIANVSTGGSISDVVSNQLPKVDLMTADIVIFADDNLGGISLARYRAMLETLAASLPADRTVISDLPGLPGEAPYQAVLAEVADAHGIMRADFKAIFNGEVRRLDIFSWLPPHLNSKGYGYWFEAFKPKVDVILKGLAGR